MQSYAARTARFADGSDSPVRVLEEYAAVIAAREPEVRAFVCLDLDRAFEEAKASQARWLGGKQLSPIDGMPIGVKDIIETEQFPTGQGAPMLEGFQSGRDAASVRAMREAGAIVIGKTSTTEFASTELFAPTRNPHDPARTPGGSSSGSAAGVGAGMIPFALASQVVGSTLRPASYNGCVGYKPTTGGLNRGGSYDYLSQSCVGLIGATLEDVWLPARAIASRAGGDPGHVGVLGPDHLPGPCAPARLALLRTDGWARATGAVRATFEARIDRFRDAGVEIVSAADDAAVAALEEAITDALDLTWRVLVWEMMWPLNTYGDRPGSSVSAAMKTRLAEGRTMTQADYGAALSRRQSARDRLRDVISGVDAIVTLGAVSAAPANFETTGDPSFNVPASYLGAPALSLPVLEEEGMPLGLQLIGGHGQDARLFALARWVMS